MEPPTNPGVTMNAKIYIDSQDSQDIGWAWSVTRDDGHEESGGGDDPQDCIDQILEYRWTHGLVPERLAGWTYHDHGGDESYRWEE